jgi:RNA polymerase subunit RPABC4/transcription elongation factor Spt4
MDAIVLKLPQTRAYVERVYGVTLVNVSEESPEARTLDAHSDTADDMVTQYVAYYRNDDGGIGVYSWCCDTELEDMDDYEARRVRKCPVCGKVTGVGRDTCPNCGTQLSESESIVDTENVFKAINTAEGTNIPGATASEEADGTLRLAPTKLPYYTPNVFPIFLQRNVSLFGKLLGDSDVDKISDQQNTINRLETKIIDRMIKAGTRITLPDRADFRVDPEDQEKWFVGNVQDKQLIDVVQFDGNLTWEMQYLPMIYEESRQALGITDSYQGRRDKTAESGVAKQFSAAQAAGRMESKRVLKEAAYAELFRRIVMLKVAYADEPRPVVASDNRGQAQYKEFNRYDFYEQDENGEWHCILDDDRFLFSCDTTAPLANNREKMWQETTTMFQMGAFGDPAQVDTLLLYWTKMDLLHYPGAGDTRAYLEELKNQQMQMQAQMAAQQQAMQDAQMQAQAMAAEQQNRQQRADAERKTMLDIDSQARNDAWRTVKQMLAQKQSQSIDRPLPT